MADLVTRLLLNNKQFDSNIKKSRKQVQEFEDMTQKFGQGIKSGFTQIAAIAGVAGGAMATFDKFVNASQTTGDAWAVKVEQMKASVDNFFYALNTGDMTSFSMGLEEIRRQAQATYDALDQLGNVRISYGYLGGKVDADIAKQRATAMDETLNPEERKEALAEWKRLVEEKKEMAINASEAAQDALFNMVAQDTFLESNSLSQSDYDKILELDLKNAKYREEEKAKLAKQYEEYRKRNEALEKVKGGAEYDSSGRAIWTWKADKEIIDSTIEKQKELAKNYKDAILYNKLLVRIKDEDLEATTAIARESDAMMRDVYNNQNQLNRGYKRVTNSVNKASGGSKEDAANEGTIKWYNDEISRLNKELSNTQDKKIAGQLQAKVNELNSEKIRLQLVIDQNAFREIHGELEDKFDANPPKLSPKLSVDLDKVKIPEIAPINNKTISSVGDYSTALTSLGSVLVGLNNSVNEGASGWITYSSNLLQSVAMAIPQIQALTAVKKAEANANAEVAASGAAASVASIPILGPIMAVAAVASVLAAVINIPKFAHGGIVPGGSYVGDLVPAMVNSGEMILNNRQQANLFSLLNNGGGKGQQVVSIGNPKVRGSDIYLSLKNYMKSTGKRL